MPTATPTKMPPKLEPLHLRVGFFREQWERIAVEAAGRPIALYGAGTHTRFFLRSVQACTRSPKVAFILDDAPGDRKELSGIPILHPQDAHPSQVSLVLVSSDRFESLLTQRASAWTLSQPGRSGKPAPTVQRLYDDDQLEQLGAKTSKFKDAWGNSADAQRDHLPASPDARVMRLPNVPARAQGELPIPPLELRAGYNMLDDAAYIEMGRADVAAMRGVIARYAPQAGPISRVLDWGCSTGRMVRHWADVAGAGGEVWGCDICATSINWASENLSPLRFFTSTMRPQLPLPDSSMDLIYGNSVFTHIRELWDTWLLELRRVVRPGGLVHTTILDETSWDLWGRDTTAMVDVRFDGLNFAEPLADDMVSHGTGVNNVTFWHSQGIRKRWSPFFDVLAIEPYSVRDQSAVLLQRRK
ncbi:MAG: class I SAM-dependent methyltransferase [Pyrinomonadaceae bacterium]|nr:class I SAM-dependent methyltransferase [Phycisphaerales bacterium]